MGRPSTQRERRNDILEAAERLLLRPEASAFRLADVADELGLTSNAVRYYYKEPEGLLMELVQRADDRAYLRRVESAELGTDIREALARVIAAGLPTGPDDVHWRVVWRAVLEAGIEYDRSPGANGMYHRQVGLYEAMFEHGASLGDFTLAAPALQIARTTMALEDYFAYRIVARDPSFTRQVSLDLVRGYVQLATGCTLPVTD